VAKTTELVIQQTIGHFQRILVVPTGQKFIGVPIRSRSKLGHDFNNYPPGCREELLGQAPAPRINWIMIAIGQGAAIEEIPGWEDYVGERPRLISTDVSYDFIRRDLLYGPWPDQVVKQSAPAISPTSTRASARLLNCPPARDWPAFVHVQMQEHYWEEGRPAMRW